MAKITSINPSNYEVLGEVNSTSNAEIIDIVKSANAAKKNWKELGLKKRIEILKNVYVALEERKAEIAEMDSTEMGFPLSQCYDFNLGDALNYFKWYLENAETHLAPEITYETEAEIHTVYYEPKGTTVVIQPWNFPFCQWSWGVVPNLVVGNTVIYKPSEEVPLSAKLIDEIIRTCDLPEGVLSFVYGDGKTGEFLLNQDINLISFTGSTATGKKLYKIAAEKFIPIVLELGGSAPGIIFEDANTEETIEAVFALRFTNCGQACDGLKRLIVHESKFEEIMVGLVEMVNQKRIGNALDKETEIGPLAAKRQLDLLKSQVEDAIKNGAKIMAGGKEPDHLSGAFYQPTILTDIEPTMRVWQEEVFGPVLPVVSFKTEAEAIELANDTQYGLGSYIFTQDKQRAERVASQIEAGMVSVNGINYVLPMNPFGGYKNSGLGREHGKYGLHDLCNVKVVAREK